MAYTTITPGQERSLLGFATAIRRSTTDLGVAEKRKTLRMLSARIEVLAKHQVKIASLLPSPEDVVDISGLVATSVK